MRAVVQRSSWGQVVVDGQTRAQIGSGLTILVGVKKGDHRRDAEYLMDKAINLRIFSDDQGKMNRSLLDVGGEILLVSQFTLYGDARKGRRPSFSDAEWPESAQPMFDYCVQYIAGLGITVQTGVFGADMQVRIENDGPCTILLDSEKLF
ncbi:MAG TPA: D-aminoacyl-tRNA deacylase [Syntrophomonadaceae bacterium]|nr:D-aminoacyl-tRNA deacylase [Syntrophomonadaceae bacterium]